METTVLENHTNEHQKAFMELIGIGMAALHLVRVYVVYASDGISAGGLFQ